MSASRLPKSARGDEHPPLEPVPGPVSHQRVERQWLGVPARFVLLCLGCAALGAAVGLFATGNWPWAFVALFVAALVFAGLAEAVRQGAKLWPGQSEQLAADGRSHAASAAEVLRTRFDSTLARWRTRSRLDAIEIERRPAFQELGEAVWQSDTDAERRARQRLKDLEHERQRLEVELAEQAAQAKQRIRHARLPVQETVMVTPNEPSQPYPPPGEGDPPQPAQVPEPYPPPDEGTPPTPAPDPDE